MKRLLCICCSILMLCACTARVEISQTEPQKEETPLPIVQKTDAEIPEIGGYADFCDTLSAALIDGSRNRNLSPISVYLALSMTAEGAKGETQADMLKLLGCASLEELRGVCGAMLEALSIDTEQSALAIADSVWMADRGGELSFDEGYQKVLVDTYRSEANTVRFGTKETSKQIANWIKTHTRNKIDLSPDSMNFDENTVMVLINAIYLKDAWRDEFYEGATKTGAFTGLNGERVASYMHRYDPDSAIVQGDGFLRYSLPLLRVGYMSFVLPDEDVALSELLGSPEKLHALLQGGETVAAHVDVKVPKFEFQDQIDLVDTLTELGIGGAFTDGADFSGMCPDKHDIAISEVLQGSYIGVNEQGVEAAAYTLVAMADGMAMPQELPEIDFHLTRPFLYTITAYDGTVLFIGTVTEPTEPTSK